MKSFNSMLANVLSVKTWQDFFWSNLDNSDTRSIDWNKRVRHYQLSLKIVMQFKEQSETSQQSTPSSTAVDIKGIIIHILKNGNMTKAVQPKYNNPRIFFKANIVDYSRFRAVCFEWHNGRNSTTTIPLKWLKSTSTKRCQAGLMCKV